MKAILDQLIYFGFLQSLLLLLVYILSPKKRKYINGFMAFLILVILIGLMGKVLHSIGTWNGNFRFIAFSEFSILLFGPTVYLFTRSILHREKYTYQDLVHYVPGVVYSLFVTFYYIIPPNEVISTRIKTGELYRVVHICLGFGLTVNSTYLILAWNLFKQFSDSIKNEVSYELHTRFIVNFLGVISACLFFWIIIYFFNLFGFEGLEYAVRPYIWILLVFIILFITYYGMASPNVMKVLPEIELKKYTQSKLSTEDLDRLKKQLDQIMIDKKPYLNSKLLKSELAQMLGVNDPELARLLNEKIGMNFFEYVNYYRIKEFIALAKTDMAKQLTFFGLAQEAGFNSKTTFNKSFKKLMGDSPSAYFNKNL